MTWVLIWLIYRYHLQLQQGFLQTFNDLIVENPGHAPIFLGILTSVIVFDDLGISLDDLYTFISDSDKDLELYVGSADVLGWVWGGNLTLPNEPLPPVITLKPDWAYMFLSIDVDANGGSHQFGGSINMNFGENLLPLSWEGPHNLIRSISVHRPGYILTSVNVYRFALHSAHNHSRERVSILTSALRMYYNRGDLTLRQFIHLRNEILEDEGIAASGLTLTPKKIFMKITKTITKK